MGKSLSKMSCVGVNSKPVPHRTETGIIVHLYQPLLASVEDKCLKFKTPGKVYTAEGLCWHAAVKLNIRPITFHIFSLYCLENEQWLAPNDKIEVKEDQCHEFEFRIRLKMSNVTVSQLPDLDPSTLNYLYLQCSHDFVKETHVGSHTNCTEDEWAKKCIGLGIINATCCLIYSNVSPSSMSKFFNYGDFLPPQCISCFRNFISSLRLKGSFTKRVKEKYQCWKDKTDLTKLKLHYILGGIFKYYSDYLVEEFRTNDDEVFIVDPLELGGLYNQTTHTLVTTIHDIVEIHIYTDRETLVHINHRNGPPIQMKFSSPQIARSLVSLLDKYYRMMEEYHVNVCKSVYSPLVSWMQEAKVHGPVRGSWAVEKIEEHNKEHNNSVRYNYILKQLNRSVTVKKASLWNIEIVLINHKNEVHHDYIEWDYNSEAPHLWNLPCIRSVEAEQKFHSLQQFLSHYSSELFLERCLRPLQTKHTDERLFLCKCKKKPDDLNLNNPVPASKYPQIIPNVTIHEQNFFEGRFTNVYTGSYGNIGKDLVAVKKLKAEYYSKFDVFTKNIQKVAFWTHSSIVHVHGICMEGSLSLILECAPLGNLQDYLSKKPKFGPVKVLHLVGIAKQISSVLYYLHERGNTHGNIRCKKILLFSHDEKSMLVKLADPGMIFSYICTPSENPAKKEVLPWLAPELLNEMGIMSPESDMYAFGVTLWEMFSMANRPLKDTSSKDIIQLARSGLILEQPEHCPLPIYDLMKQCCKPDPSSRLSSRVALRDINSFEIVTDYHVYNRPICLNGTQNSTNTGGSQAKPAIIHDPLLIEERELHIKRSKILGTGFYGQVYLAEYIKEGYDPRKVAVKSLKPAIFKSCVQFEREFKIMAELQHENIVEVIGHCPRESNVEPMLIAMEYIENGCLEQFLIKNKNSLNQSHLMRFAIDISAGMLYLSSKLIVHNDLAARNVLVTTEKRAKISDFGLAKLLPSNKDYYKDLSTKYKPIYWWAPEAIFYHKVSHKSDVWSYGITLWEVYSLGKSPCCMGKIEDVPMLLEKGTRLGTKSLDCPQDVRNLMKRCWEYDPKNRPNFRHIYNKLSFVRNTQLNVQTQTNAEMDTPS